MAKYREIELKWKVPTEGSMSKLLELYTHIPPSSRLDAYTIDEYWNCPGSGQFVRLRNSWGNYHDGTPKKLKEITAKKKDKGGNVNRMEINVDVESIQDTRKLLELVLGEKPYGRIKKDELVLFCEDGAVLSLSYVNEHITYLEVEAPSEALIEKHRKKLVQAYALEVEPRSLFEIYIEKTAVHIPS